MNLRNRLQNRVERAESKKVSLFSLLWSIGILYVLTVLQTSFSFYFKIGNAAFDLLLPAAIFISMYTNEYFGMAVGVGMGAIFDMVNNSRIPIMPIVFLLICGWCGSQFKDGKKGEFVRKYIMLAACLLIRYVITFFLEFLRNSTPGDHLFKIIIPGFLYTLVLSPIVMLICSPAAKGN